MNCSVCGFDGDFNKIEVVAEVEVETTIECDDYGEMYNTNRGNVKHSYITLSSCPVCKLVYNF